jgi:hypothetical protein
MAKNIGRWWKGWTPDWERETPVVRADAVTRSPLGQGSGQGRTSPTGLNHPDLASAFVGELPSNAIAICDTPGGGAPSSSEDGPLPESMT